MPTAAHTTQSNRFAIKAEASPVGLFQRDDEPMDSVLTMNLEQYRIRQGWSYAELADEFEWSDGRTAQRYALGINYPSPCRVEKIRRRTDGAVSVLAMHLAHINYLRTVGKAPGLELVSPPVASSS